jgi:hypothetical protein
MLPLTVSACPNALQADYIQLHSAHELSAHAISLSLFLSLCITNSLKRETSSSTMDAFLVHGKIQSTYILILGVLVIMIHLMYVKLV